jgi:integrase
VSVLKHVKRTKVDDDVRQPLSDRQLEAVLQAAGRPGSRDFALLVLAAGSGLRLNELRELRVGDLDLRARTITVRPETSKFGRGRLVHVHDDVGRELDRYLRETRFDADANAPLFPTRSGAYFTDTGFDKIFQRIAARSGIRSFSAHVLRHTWATNFMRAPNASLLELKRQGGWERWEMVERYSHATPPRDRGALPNPLQTHVQQQGALHKSAFSQMPVGAQKRLSLVSPGSA